MATGTTSRKSAAEVLFDNEGYFKNYVTANLKKVVSVMIEKKVVSKKLAKLCMKTNDSELLLADMKQNMTLDNFLGCLEILTEFGSQEEYDGETRKLMRLVKGSLVAMGAEPNSRHDAVIKRFIAVASFDQAPGPAEQSQHLMAESATFTETTIEEPITDPRQHTLSHPASTQTVAAPDQPPPSQFENTVSYCFTRKGGVLYSPVHGVTVRIPPNAIPQSIDTVNLSMHFYLDQPFTVEEDVYGAFDGQKIDAKLSAMNGNVDLCSVVVWFHLSPPVEFLEDVTVEIPHAARADLTSLCVLTWGEDKQGPPYKLNTEVPADFSDGYHAVFKVRQFSPYAIAKATSCKKEFIHKTRNPTISKRAGSGSSSTSKSLDKMDSASVEESCKEGLAVNVGRSSSADSSFKLKQLPHQDALDIDPPVSMSLEGSVRVSGIRYSIACSMPKDRSGGQWEVNFAVSYGHPTGNWVLLLAKKAWEESHGSGCDMRNTSFCACSDCLELHPQTWSDSCWTVFAVETNLLSISDVKSVPPSSRKRKFEELISAKLYPPSVTYCVQGNDSPTHTALRHRINVSNAKALNGDRVFFVLTSSFTPGHLQFKPQAEQSLYISSYLYGDKSDVIRAAAVGSTDIVLNIDTPDHIKFLAEIGFQLSNPTILSHALHLSQSELDHIMLECQRIGDVYFSSYKLLIEWVIRNGDDAKLSNLKDALNKMGFKDIQKLENSDDFDVLIRPVFEKYSFPNICSSEVVSTINDEVTFALKLGGMLRCCWWRVGSLMGIPLIRLDEIDVAASSDISYTPGYSMLLEWQRRNGREATLGTVFKALKCMYYHRASAVNHALWYATQFAENRLHCS